MKDICTIIPIKTSDIPHCFEIPSSESTRYSAQIPIRTVDIKRVSIAKLKVIFGASFSSSSSATELKIMHLQKTPYELLAGKICMHSRLKLASLKHLSRALMTCTPGKAGILDLQLDLYISRVT